MNRVFNKVIIGLLSVLFVYNSALAIEAEFKNSLVKVDLIKVNDNAYDVNLYTQNKYQEPVKVIKKSDLNYYILLPETKNNVAKTSFSGSEIRNISTDLYPYAGQDVNNGYTKININTTKPLNLNVNVRNVAAASKIAKHATESALANAVQEEQIKKEETQKKNSVSSNAKTVNTLKKERTKQDIKPASLKPKINPIVPKEIIKTNEAIKKEIEAPIQETIEETQVPEEVLVDLDENKIIEEDNKELISENETKEIEQIANDNENKFLNNIKEKITYIFQDFANKFNQNGISLINLILMLGATIITFLFVFKTLSKRNEQTARLKSRADLIDKDEINTNKSIQINTQAEPKNDGQYFVFDKNIKQTGFCDPATSAIKRNYELSSYEPELKNKYSRTHNPNQYQNKHTKDQNNNEYDIIQKILKEDSFIDISADEYKEAKQTLNDDAPVVKTIQTPIKEQKIIEPPAEPTVLSSVEIAPERGFMCVSYNDNINLMGYIFDDVFPLYNFKVPKLENYDIKFRLSERDDKGARFIVKVTDTKMLIKVTKSSMNTEVLL